MSQPRGIPYPRINDVLNREHPRVLREYAMQLRIRASDDVSAHVERCVELATRLEVVALRERPIVTEQDLRFLDIIAERLLDLEREHPLASYPPQHMRLTLGQGIRQLRELAAPFVSSPSSADGP